MRVPERISIGERTTTARGMHYLTEDDLNRFVAAGLIQVLGEERDRQGNLKKILAELVKYVESDTALVNRMLSREVGGKQNILVINDEAHHAYRILKPAPEEGEEETLGESEIEEFFREATIWIDGLDRIHKLRGINCCADLSATPLFPGARRVGHQPDISLDREHLRVSPKGSSCTSRGACP